MARGITDHDVFAACDALLLAGERPTIERVRQKIGRGSPNTVSPMLDAWFKGLGRRLQDPGAFAAPPDVPEPILQAAQHFWETALAHTRADFDARLREGLATAAANVESEKKRAEQAQTATREAHANATRLEQLLAEQGRQLDRAQQDLAAERARLEGVRAALATATSTLREHETQTSAEMAELRRQLEAALQRADAADRRVALELERERTARAKSERQVDALQRTLSTERQAALAAGDRAQALLNAARDREQAQATLHAAAAAELALERERIADLRAAGEASAADAVAARAQIATLQASLDRLANLAKSGTRKATPVTRKRSAIASPPGPTR